MRSRAPAPLLTCALAAIVTLAACSSGSDTGAPPDTGPLPTLPSGPLVEFVLQPADVPRDLVPFGAQSGPLSLTKLAEFSADPKSAAASLNSHGFVAAYGVQYGNPQTQAVITNVVVSFAAADGAEADLNADLSSSRLSGETYVVSGLGDQAGGVRGKLDVTRQTGHLITLRWRLGSRTWLLAVGSPQEVDEAAVRLFADLLVERAGSSPSPSPSP